MGEYIYFPTIKTRDAELKGVSFLDNKIKNSILPTFELTRPRPYSTGKGESRKTNHKDLEIQIARIFESFGERAFVLDVTDDVELHNPQMSQLLSPKNGYSAWCDFVEQEKIADVVVPSLQIDTSHLSDTRKEFARLSAGFRVLALNIDFFEFKQDFASVKKFSVSNRIINKDIVPIIQFVLENIGKAKLLVNLNLGYIPHRDASNYFVLIERELATIKVQLAALKKKEQCEIILTLSSFPNYVLAAAKGKCCDEFPCVENQDLIPLCKKEGFLTGDYAAIHPVKYPVGGGGWVPRIDFMSRDGSKYVYCRNESTDAVNGYITSAQQVLEHSEYVPHEGVVGDMEIENAAEGELKGRAPAFWIAVRMDLFVTQKVLRLKKGGTPSLVL